MNENKGCMIFLFVAFLLIAFMMLTVTITTARKLESFIKAQEQVNETTYEQDQQQSKDIRLLKQDNEINKNLLISKEFLKEKL